MHRARKFDDASLMIYHENTMMMEQVMEHKNAYGAKLMQPIEELRYLILAAQREGNRLFAEALRPLQLTPSQAEVLRVLQDHEPLSLVALGDLLVCETGSPSRLVQGLVEDGLVERSPSATDKRMVTLTLTNQGRERAANVGSLESQFYEANAGLLKDASLQEIRAVLWRFVEGKPAGMALARRMGKEAEGEHLAL
jgi:MarR family transcriptional regulator, organic hydroperoxide resistance regulator